VIVSSRLLAGASRLTLTWSPILFGGLALACGTEDEINGVCWPDERSPVVSVEIGLEGLQSLADPHYIAEENSVHLVALVSRREPCAEDIWASTEEPVTWTSSNPDLATVYLNGIVHAYAAGSVTISASIEATSGEVQFEILPVGSVPPFDTLVSGTAQSCALTNEGIAYCWGDGIPNFCLDGTAGPECGSDYTTGPLSAPEWPWGWATCSFGDPRHWSDPSAHVSDFPCSRVPSRYTIGVSLSSIAVGGGTFVSSSAADVCGHTGAGALYCGGTVGPLRAMGSVYTTVSVGASHACALDPGGTAHCWGSNRFGELGDSTKEAHETPQPVRADRQFTALGTAFHLTCGLATDGRAFCWGASWLGQAGNQGDIESCPWRSYINMPCSLIPRPVSDTAFRQLSVGGGDLSQTHVCALTIDGAAYCWGGNYEGSLGNGTHDWSPDPTPVAGDLRFESISAGGSHTCGITLDGDAYCWGSNMWGQLGHPGITASPVPVPVTSDTTFALIAAGSAHTCGLCTDGTVYCWGYNEGGQLGNGMLGHHDTPTRIAGHD
jgi:alpha-tubulin suppressor-like RCC1 family protein